MDKNRLKKIAKNVRDKRWWIELIDSFWGNVYEDVNPILDGDGDYTYYYEPAYHTSPGYLLVDEVPSLKIRYPSPIFDIRKTLESVKKDRFIKLVPNIEIEDFMNDPDSMKELKTRLASPFEIRVPVIADEITEWKKYFDNDSDYEDAIVIGKVQGTKVKVTVKLKDEKKYIEKMKKIMGDEYLKQLQNKDLNY